jgi:acyl carrier protein
MEDRINTVMKQVFDLTDAELAQDLSRTDIAKWDSLTHMDLIVSLEREFHVTLEIDDIIAINSIESIRTVLKTKGVL